MSVSEMMEVKLNGEGCVFQRKRKDIYFCSIGCDGIACPIFTNVMSAPKEYYFQC
jgi:hypothetical protein